MSGDEDTNKEVVNIKWNHEGVFRRYQVPLNNGYTTLLSKITSVIPGFHGPLTWKDEDGDSIVMSSNEDFTYAVSLIGNKNLLRLYSTDSKTKTCSKNDLPFDRITMKEANHGIYCNVCDKPVVGIRYNCPICSDFDLCEGCERKGLHEEHAMIRYVSSETLPLGRFHYSHRKQPCGFRQPFSQGIFDTDGVCQKIFKLADEVLQKPVNKIESKRSDNSVLQESISQAFGTIKEVGVQVQRVFSDLEKNFSEDCKVDNAALKGLNEENKAKSVTTLPNNEKDGSESNTETQNSAMDTSDVSLLVDSEIPVEDVVVTDGWTIMGPQSEPSQNAKIYPSLTDGHSECCAGTAFVTPLPGPHTPHCFFIPHDPKVAKCVENIEEMGFDNCNGWITKLAVLMDGDVSRVIEALSHDKVYAARLENRE